MTSTTKWAYAIAALLVAAHLGLSSAGGVALASPAEDAREILRAAGVRGGLVVHLGCGDGRLTAALRANDRYLVQGLDRDPTQVDNARAHLRSLGLYGKVSADRLTGKSLPYTDNLVNLLVSEDLNGMAMAEVLRVLAPGGVAYLRAGDKWTRTVKPRPSQIDEWTHWLHGPDNNAVAEDTVVGPPCHLQWTTGPTWARSHEHLASVSTAVSSGGRLFYVVDLGDLSSVALPPKWFLIARDAFSGVILWKRPIVLWEDHLTGSRAGPSQLGRRLVAVGDRVYVTLAFGKPLLALDAATGETVKEYAGSDGTREILFDQGRVCLVAGDAATETAAASFAKRRGVVMPPREGRISVLEADSGKLLWSKSDADTATLRPGTLAVAEGRVYYMNANEVICLDAGSGQRQWRAARPVVAKPSAAPTLVVFDKVVLTADLAVTPDPKYGAHSSEVIAFSAATGERLWAHKASEGYVSATNVLVANGLVWSGRMWSVVDPGITEAWDPVTGEVRFRKPPDTPDMLGMSHHRCYRDRATCRYLVLGRVGVEFLDVQSGEMILNHWVRGMCQFGVLPCNGLLYTTPHPCACYVEAMYSGFHALAARRPGESLSPKAPAGDQLERGPAYGEAAAEVVAGDGGWPTYRHDAARSGITKSAVPTALRRGWQTDVGGRLSSLVVAQGRVFVASIDAHTVLALAADDGKVVWSRTVGGRVDSPPTVYQGQVLFGSADGWVYCLRASDGRLQWRFRAASEDRRVVARDQLESLWPVHGSVLVANDAVYFAAGRSSYLDGGIYLYRLNPASGEKLSVTRIDSRDPKTGQQPKGAIQWVRGFEMAGALPDVLSCQNGTIFMRHKPFDRNGAEQSSTVPHLFSPAGFLDDSWWHRTYWLYGTKMSSGFRDWALAGSQLPGGEILVTDGSVIYGYGRSNYAKHGSHARLGLTGYRLFAADPQLENARKPPPDLDASASSVKFRWAAEVPQLVRAMLLADQTLWIAGPPDSRDLAEAAAGLEGKRGGLLWAVSASDGKRLSEYRLDSPPVFDGMAAAGGRLYLSLDDGRVLCLKD